MDQKSELKIGIDMQTWFKYDIWTVVGVSGSSISQGTHGVISIVIRCLNGILLSDIFVRYAGLTGCFNMFCILIL